MKLRYAVLVALLTTPAAAELAPAPGCYERAYDAAHLATHRGQIIDHVWAEVSPREEPASMPFSVTLQLSVKNHSKSKFRSLGACEEQRDSLLCVGSLSAEERGLCKRKGDGVRSCRINYDEAGSFRVKPAPDGVLVTIVERLETHTNLDQGDYLYLSPGNAENHAFLLKPAPPEACK